MTTKVKIAVRQERFYSAHHTMLRIARVALGQSGDGVSGCTDHQFTAITFAAFSIEPFCNAVGGRIFPNWEDFEYCSTPAKIRIIWMKLGAEYNPKSEPWKSVEWLCELRNKIAHPKAKPIDHSTVHQGWVKANERHRIAPPSDLERQINANNAKRALDTVDAAINDVLGRMSEEDRSGIFSDNWTTSAQQIIAANPRPSKPLNVKPAPAKPRR